jgi:hypothetical protein
MFCLVPRTDAGSDWRVGVDDGRLLVEEACSAESYEEGTHEEEKIMTKATFVVCVVMLSALVTAGPNSSFRLEAPATVGTNKLKPGDYKIDVKGDQAVIKAKDGKSFSVPVKIEQAGKQFNEPAVG